VLADELVVNREMAARQLALCAEWTLMRVARSTVGCGRRRLGKTLLLQRLYNALFCRQRDLLPLYFTMQLEFRELAAFAQAFVTNFVRQYVAFRDQRRDLVVYRNMRLDQLEELIATVDHPFFREEVGDVVQMLRLGEDQMAFYNATLLPQHVGQFVGPQMLVIFDEFQRVADMTRGGQPCSEAQSFQSQVESMAFAPWIVSGSSYHLINYVVGQDPYFGRFDTIDLEPLQGDVLLELVDRLSRYYQIDVVGEARAMLLGEGYGNPFYVHSLVRRARNLGQTRMATREDVRAAMEAEMTGGLIFRDWERHSAAGYLVEKCVADLINQWRDGDGVPAILFDWDWFRRATAEEREQELARPSRTVRLMRPIVPAVRNSFIQVEAGKPAKEIDIGASGLWEDYEMEIGSYGDEVPVKRWTPVTWVIGVRCRAERTDAPHVKGFVPKVEAQWEYEVRRAEGKPAHRPPVVLGWLISKAGFTAEALALARQRGYYTSDLEQLNRLFRRFGLAEIRADLT